MSLERADVVGALTAKGFKEQPDRSHDYYWLYVDGKKTQINTHVSRGTAYKTLGDDLVWAMAKQLKITTKQFRQLVECTLSEVGYIAAVRSQQIELPPRAKAAAPAQPRPKK